MKVGGTPYRSIWLDDDGWSVCVIDQTALPERLETLRLETAEHAAAAISEMRVRGAPLIGATAAYGVALAMRADPSDDNLARACDLLRLTRPTAVNLAWALDTVRPRVAFRPLDDRAPTAYGLAAELCDADVALNRSIGEHGLALLKELAGDRPGRPLHVMTHCNAGWLATVDVGTALAPVYLAHDEGLDVHVWVSETRPRNQGALTAWELAQHGVPHTVIADSAAGHLMQRGEVDVCITGADRVARNGDVANKIGTYLKALAARANDVPFYVAAPSPSIDWELDDGSAVPIEQRSPEELSTINGAPFNRDGGNGDARRIRLMPEGSPVSNYGFDVTPAELIRGLISERGVAPASEDGLLRLFPERTRAEEE